MLLTTYPALETTVLMWLPLAPTDSRRMTGEKGEPGMSISISPVQSAFRRYQPVAGVQSSGGGVPLKTMWSKCVGNREDPFGVQPTRRNEVIEGPAFDELHRQKVEAVSFLDGVDRDDGRMIDRRDRTGLAPEAIEHLVTRGHWTTSATGWFGRPPEP